MTSRTEAAPLADSTDDQSGGKQGRVASREARQLQLIEATIDSLASRGYSGTTLADVATGAGLSRGIVNFHFESKDKLLVATLEHMSKEYSARWRAAYRKGSGDPVRQLAAIVASDFDRSICNKRKLAAWCAFWGEAKSRPTYQSFCGARDTEYQNVLIEICQRLKDDGGYAFNAISMALALSAMLEGLWLRLLLSGDGLTRANALQAAMDCLSSVFPKHFSPRGSEVQEARDSWP